MKINNIQVEVCVSSLGQYKYKPSDTNKDMIIEGSRYKKYIRLYLLDKHLGYVTKDDANVLLEIIKRMNGYVRVTKWSLVTETYHYLIIRLHLQPFSTYRYYIYQLSFNDTNDTYIGSTKNLPQRLTAHRKKLKDKIHINKLLQQAYDKYPDKMCVDIMFTGETNDKEVKFKKEQEFILKHKQSLNLINSYVPKGKILCECGRHISYTSLQKHKKTKYHKSRVTTQSSK